MPRARWLAWNSSSGRESGDARFSLGLWACAGVDLAWQRLGVSQFAVVQMVMQGKCSVLQWFAPIARAQLSVGELHDADFCPSLWHVIDQARELQDLAFEFACALRAEGRVGGVGRRSRSMPLPFPSMADASRYAANRPQQALVVLAQIAAQPGVGVIHVGHPMSRSALHMRSCSVWNLSTRPLA
ncbi:MAG: hypothetical protein R3E92_18815 [Burkholderiaceae bacterium]